MMFCPKCGSPEQSPETFCRSCGIYLPDLDSLRSSEQPPEMHIKANAVLSIMTIVASLAVVAMLIAAFYGRETPVVIYPAAGLLVAISAWQIQTFWRTILLRRQLERDLPRWAESKNEHSIGGRNQPQLSEAEFENYIKVSVTERTTRDLAGNKTSSTQPKH